MKKIAVIFAALILLLIGLPVFAGPSETACDNNLTGVCIVEVNNWTGNLSARVCAGNESINLNASLFNFWYDDTAVLNATGFGIVDAYWDNETQYDLSVGMEFNSLSDSSCVDVIFNSSIVNFTFDMVALNLSTNYSDAYVMNENSTMITMNYVVVKSTDGGDAVLANTIFMTFDNESKNMTSQVDSETMVA